MSRTSLTRRSLATLAGFAVAAGGAAGFLALSAGPAAATTVSTESEFRSAWATDATITLAADITLTCEGGGRAERNSDTAFTLDGQGHTITQTCADNGVLKVDADGTPNGVVQDVTITGGTENGGAEHGGGLFFASHGTLRVDRVAILDNTTCADGGGLDYEGDGLIITHSTIAGNTAQGSGGALWAGHAAAFVQDSTVSGNRSSSDTAFQTGGGNVTLTYVTMVQNSVGQPSNCVERDAVTADGHGPSASATTTPQLDVSEGTLTSFGSVVALPGEGVVNCDIASSPSPSQGYNFSDDQTCGFQATGDRENAGDPGLGALGANGGLAPTQVPQTGSPLIDAIPVAACQTGSALNIGDDERGVLRPQGAGCDIGAVEVVATVPTPPTPEPVVVAPHFTG